MMIEYLEIKIIPTQCTDTADRELRILMKVFGKPEYRFRQIMYQNDLISFFDQYFDHAKQMILTEIKGLK